MKKVFAAVLCVVLVLSMGVCTALSDSISTDSAGSASGKVTMWTFLNPEGTGEREVALKKIIENFSAKYPGIDVVVEPQEWNVLASKFLAGHQVGTNPDIIWIQPDNVPMAVKAGALEPLENYAIKNWSAEEIADIDNAFFQHCSEDEKHYIVGMCTAAYLLYYRDDLFREKNINAPFEDWDALIEAAKQLTEVDASGLQRWGIGLALNANNPDPMPMGSIIAALQDGNIVNEDGSANWNNANGLRALQLQKDLIFEHKVCPEESLSAIIEDCIMGYCSGKFAMMIAHSNRMAYIREKMTVCDPISDIKTMAYPKTDGNVTPYAAMGWSIAMWSGSPNKEAAGLFYEHMISKESDAIWVMDAKQNPIHLSTTEEHQDFFSQPENAFYEVAKNEIKNGFIPQSPTTITGWISDLNRVMENACFNGMSDEEALAQAEKEFNERNGIG